MSNLKYNSNWLHEQHICYICGATKSVKYEFKRGDKMYHVCNKCALRYPYFSFRERK